MTDPIVPFIPRGGDAASARFDAIVLCSEHSAQGAAAEAAIAALGGNAIVHVLADAAAQPPVDLAGRSVAVLDVAELPLDAAGDAVAQIAAAAEPHDVPLIVAIARAQIDAVAAALLGVATQAQLLCEAPASEWVAALALAVAEDGSHGSRVRESEAARLARLNEEVARIAEVLARLSRRDEPERGAGKSRGTFAEGAPMVTITAAEVRDVIRARRLRERFFPAGLFEDPAWDMLLDLFAAHLERGQVSVSSLCIAAAVAPTTALRWIGKMTDAGLLSREADPFDRRRAFVTLTATAHHSLARYLAALGEFGLRLA